LERWGRTERQAERSVLSAVSALAILPSSVIRLHTLGPVDLRDDGGRELRAVLQQPKRLALLAYLAVASPRRFHRRDSLLALFWPELDQEHARAALRRALYFLRSELGAGAVEGRGDDEVAAPEAEVWCDAAALEGGLAAGDAAGAAAALGLYRGPLLDGLYVAGAAPELQDWLDRERLRYRELAASAARRLAEAAEREGRAAEAAEWARREVSLAPDDEAALRRAVALLERTGDSPGAIRAYDEFARRLARELELEPSGETRELVEAVRTRAGGRSDGQTVRRADGQMADGRMVDAAEAARESASVIAVLPFVVRGDARFAYLGEGLVDLLSTRLDGAGEITTVDPRALLAGIGRELGGEGGVGAGFAGSGSRAVELARRFGAGRTLEGSLVAAGGRLQATATLYDLERRAVASVKATAGSEAELFELVDELARQLLGAQGVSSAAGTRLARIAALTTGSLDALKPYLRGERELRAGRYFDALDGFQEAVDADPSFALAWYRLAAAAAGCALPDAARAAAARGAEHEERLSPHARLMFAAQRAWLAGEVDRAESLYGTVAASWPDDVEAWFHLGDLLFHSNPLRGRSAAEARGAFERVIGLEPDHVGALVHLVRIAGIEGDTSRMLDGIGRVLDASPDGDQALALRALRAWTRRDAADIAAVTAELRPARAVTVAIAFSDVALYARNPAGAAELARGFIQVARTPELRALCHVMLAHLALAAGDRTGADAELRAAEALDPVWGVETRALFATMPFVPMDERELRETRDAVERLDPSAAPPSGFSVFAIHEELHPAIRLYLLGLLELRLGDLASAAERLEALAELESGRPLARNLIVELDAALTAARGRPAEALAKLDRARPELWFQLTVASPFFTLASQRYLRAGLLEEMGRTEEAAAWRAAMAERSPYEMVWKVGGGAG
jgi:DNA-binding SARP family transcriptional activator